MKGTSFTRRAFVGLATSATAAALAACNRVTLRGPRPQQQATAVPKEDAGEISAGTAATVVLTLQGRSADVWAWEKQVTGTCDCPEDACAAIFVESSRGRVEAERAGGTFAALVPLTAGQNEVVAICQAPDGSESVSSPLMLKVPMRDYPRARIRASMEDGAIVFDGSESEPSPAAAAPIVGYTWSPRAGNPAEIVVRGSNGEQPLSAEPKGERLVILPAQTDGEYYVTLRVVDENGKEDASTNYFVVEGGEPRIPDYDTENPAWIENAVVYGANMYLFGDFPAITGRLDDLSDLGINTLWLSPVTLSPLGESGYAVTGYFLLDPLFGSDDDFRGMVQAAHERGIRVLIDFVPNHTSNQHPYYKSGQSGESPYYDFYDRDENGIARYEFTYTHLPRLNYENPDVRRFMLAAFAYWVREFDIDGYRVDAAWSIRERRPDFWPEWRRELKRIKPDLLLIAEGGARDDYYFENGFDAAYDWDAGIGHWAWQRVFDSQELMSYNLHSALTNQRRGFHEDALIFRFINNNDTGERFIDRHGEALTRAFAALLLTLPGIPCVYTGDEIGASYLPYYDEEPISWEERYEGLRDHYKKLISLRKEVPSLHSRHWLPLLVSPTQQMYAYLRFVEPAQQPVLVVLNFSDQGVEAEIELPAEFQSLGTAGTLRDLLNDEDVEVGGDAPLRVSIGAHQARIMQPEA